LGFLDEKQKHRTGKKSDTAEIKKRFNSLIKWCLQFSQTHHIIVLKVNTLSLETKNTAFLQFGVVCGKNIIFLFVSQKKNSQIYIMLF